ERDENRGEIGEERRVGDGGEDDGPVPDREVAGEQQSGRDHQAPVDGEALEMRAAGEPRPDPQHGQGERDAPERGGHRSGFTDLDEKRGGGDGDRARQQSGDGRDPVVHGFRPLARQWPVNRGLRFSMKARMPSFWSCEENRICSDFTSRASALVIGASMPASTASFASWIASGGSAAIWRARSMARPSTSGSGTTSLARPIS